MKNLKILSKMLGGLLVLGILAACSKNNDEDIPPRVPTHVQVDYQATVSQQLLDIADVVVRYIDENGHAAVERMTATTWTKHVVIPLPTKAGMSIVPNLKSGVSDGEYSIEVRGEMTYCWLENGEFAGEGLTVSTPQIEGVFYASSVGEYLKAIASTCQVARAFTSDYTVNNATITIGTNSEDNTQNTGISDEGANGDSR